MKLDEIYYQIKERLDKIDFSRLWNNFHPFKFAIYDDDKCFFDGKYIEKDNRFIANTAIDYDGEYIAIWYLNQEPNDYDKLTASLVHEMFHAFQYENNETRWANEFDALVNYKYDIDNLSLKLIEADIISDILINDNRQAFNELLNIRKIRSKRFPYEYSYEANIEQIEATANYIEFKTLAQLDVDKAKERFDNLISRINNPEKYLPIRIISYDIGALFIECIKRNMDYDFIFNDIPYSDDIIKDIDIVEKDYPINNKVKNCITEYYNQTKKIVDDALSKNEIVLEGLYQLSGLNVYDARYDGKYATSTFFVSYLDNNQPQFMQGNFVIELDKKLIIHKIYRQ